MAAGVVSDFCSVLASAMMINEKQCNTVELVESVRKMEKHVDGSRGFSLADNAVARH